MDQRGASASRSGSDDDEEGINDRSISDFTQQRQQDVEKPETEDRRSTAIAIGSITAKVKSLTVSATDKDVKDVRKVGMDKLETDAGSICIASTPRIQMLISSDDSLSPNPFCLPEVIAHLFLFVNAKKLKEMRLVCKQWDKIACNKLMKRTEIIFRGKNERSNVNNVMKIMHQNAGCGFQHFKFVYEDMTLLNVFTRTLRMHIRTLKFGRELSTPASVKRVLLSFPNLEELWIFCRAKDFMTDNPDLGLNDAKFQLKSLNLGGEIGIHPNIIVELFNSCPNLKSFSSIYFTAMNSIFVTNLFMLASSGKINLSKLDVLNLGGANGTVISTYAILSLGVGSYPMKLSRLELAVSEQMDLLALCALLISLKETLQEFICGMNVNSVGFQVLIPKCMDKLVKLEIFTGNNTVCMGPLISAFHLPNLQKLYLTRQPNPQEIGQIAGSTVLQQVGEILAVEGARAMGVQFNFDKCWNIRKAEDVQQCRNFSLQALTLPLGFTNPEMFTELATIFPNLRDLCLNDPPGNVIRAVLALCYPNLERLTLHMFTYPPDIDSILTGLNKSWCKKMIETQKFKFANPEQAHAKPGLRNMTNLKYLALRQYRPLQPCPSYRGKSRTKELKSYLSEVTLHHGLIYLTRAIQLDLQGCDHISQASIEMLRSTLGPSCYVNIIDKTESVPLHFWAG